MGGFSISKTNFQAEGLSVIIYLFEGATGCYSSCHVSVLDALLLNTLRSVKALENWVSLPVSYI